MKHKPFKVLIVDDELDMAENLERILRKASYETVVETESTRVLDCIERERPDLLLTDLCMPGLDGLTLLEQLRSRQCTLPVIVLTACAWADVAVQAKQMGASDFLTKLCCPEELMLKVAQALG
jgi:DNA-binding NtrC family response regulator